MQEKSEDAAATWGTLLLPVSQALLKVVSDLAGWFAIPLAEFSRPDKTGKPRLVASDKASGRVWVEKLADGALSARRTQAA